MTACVVQGVRLNSELHTTRSGGTGDQAGRKLYIALHERWMYDVVYPDASKLLIASSIDQRHGFLELGVRAAASHQVGPGRSPIQTCCSILLPYIR